MDEVQAVNKLLERLGKLEKQLQILDEQIERSQKLIKYCQEVYPTNSDPGKKGQSNK